MIKLYTDGACSPNPGLGGWAAYFIYNNVKYVTYGYEEDSTNNRMELRAAIEGLRLVANTLKKLGIELKSEEVHLYSDSQYFVNTMNLNWRRNANQELWEIIDKAVNVLDVHFIWVKGHASNPGNNECDELAVKARTNKEIKSYNVSTVEANYPIVGKGIDIKYEPDIMLDIPLKDPNVIREPKLYVETPNQADAVPSNYHYNKDKYIKNEELLYKCKDLILELDDKIHPLAELLRSDYYEN
jgi:ribonuclease HI